MADGVRRADLGSATGAADVHREALSKSTDTVLLVAAAGTSKRRDVARAAAQLTAVGAPLHGVLLVERATYADDSKEQDLSRVLHSQRSEQTATPPENT